MIGENYNKNDQAPQALQAPQAPQQATKWNELSSEGVFNEDQAQANRQEAKEQIESIERQELEKTTIDKINKNPKAKRIFKKIVLGILVGASIAGGVLFTNQAVEPKSPEVAPKTLSQHEAETNIREFIDIDHSSGSRDFSWDAFIYGRLYGDKPNENDNPFDKFIEFDDGKQALWYDDQYNNDVLKPSDDTNAKKPADIIDINQIQVNWSYAQQQEQGGPDLASRQYTEYETYRIIDADADGKWDIATKREFSTHPNNNSKERTLDLHESEEVDSTTITMQKVEDLFKNHELTANPDNELDTPSKNTEAKNENTNAGERVVRLNIAPDRSHPSSNDNQRIN